VTFATKRPRSILDRLETTGGIFDIVRMMNILLCGFVKNARRDLKMSEKYIFCPACNTLTIHARSTGEIVGWICERCNPPLGEF
jgi:hypothetical protein